jgi:uncharacterized iron-regulated membrane protein
MSGRALRLWAATHKWTSLACTLFLLMLCITGLPLVFRDEIDDAIFGTLSAPRLDAMMAPASLDRIVEVAHQRFPGEYVRVLAWEDDDPNVIKLSIVPTAESPSSRVHRLAVDARTAEVLGEPAVRRGFTSFLAGLHRDMLVGLPGALLLGVMGLLFFAALGSGMVLYAPYMRRHAFGTVRTDRSLRIRFLDLHNLLGVVTVAWAIVVGFTGALNTLAVPLFAQWRIEVLADLLAPYRGRPPPGHLSSVDAAVDTARRALPGTQALSVVFPNNRFGSPRHYLIWMRGQTALTSRVTTPVLVEAETGALASAAHLPVHLQMLQVSRPLHFGDYGGLPLKIIWALLDLATIVVLGSGLYLWLARKPPAEAYDP